MRGLIVGYVIGAIIGGIIAVGIVLGLMASGLDVPPWVGFLIGIPIGSVCGFLGGEWGMERWD